MTILRETRGSPLERMEGSRVSGSRLQRNDPSGGFGATDTLRGGRGTGEERARGTASEYRDPEARKGRGPQDDNQTAQLLRIVGRGRCIVRLLP
jgi:hypothetical protein